QSAGRLSDSSSRSLAYFKRRKIPTEKSDRRRATIAAHRSFCLRKINEGNHGWITDRREVAGRGEMAGFRVDAKRGDVVAALIAAGEELAGGVEGEAAGIVSAGCGFADECDVAVLSYGEDGNCVVQAIAGVNEAAIGRDENFRAEVAAGKTGRQC